MLCNICNDHPGSTVSDGNIEVPSALCLGFQWFCDDGIFRHTPTLTVVHTTEIFNSLVGIVVTAAFVDARDLNAVRHSGQHHLLVPHTAPSGEVERSCGLTTDYRLADVAPSTVTNP